MARDSHHILAPKEDLSNRSPQNSAFDFLTEGAEGRTSFANRSHITRSRIVSASQDNTLPTTPIRPWNPIYNLALNGDCVIHHRIWLSNNDNERIAVFQQL
jgi:hypothetical protein